jgi:vacuolar-type H+-ATPase subunit E/Vma4
MALDELRRNIEQEAKTTASKLSKEADTTVDKIIKDAKEKADAMKKSAKEDATAEVEQKRKDLITSLEIESTGLISNAKEESIQSQIRDFNALIKRGLQDKESEIIKSAIKRFAEVIPISETTVKISKENAALVKSAGKVEFGNISGIILESMDGQISADATVDGIIQSNTDLIRRVLSEGAF